MRRLPRIAATIGLGLTTLAILATGSLLLGLASIGLFATSGAAWTTELRLAGVPMKINVIAAMRLATLPGATHLLDGRSFRARAGRLEVARAREALRIRCAPCRVENADLASVPVALRSVVLDVRRDEDRLEGTLVVGDVRVVFKGRLGAGAVDLAWQLPSTELAVLYRALGDAIPESTFARIEGRVQAEGTLSLPSRRARITWSGEGWEVAGWRPSSCSSARSASPARARPTRT